MTTAKAVDRARALHAERKVAYLAYRRAADRVFDNRTPATVGEAYAAREVWDRAFEEYRVFLVEAGAQNLIELEHRTSVTVTDDDGEIDL